MNNHDPINAEIINIGDELLAGHTLNSNATWMSQKLREKGVRVVKHVVIADEKLNHRTIQHALRLLNEEMGTHFELE